MLSYDLESSSFRDPSGFLFRKNEILYRQIIEFIPKNDSQVQRLLTTREDIFEDYTKENFEKEFSKYFKINEFINIQESERVLYHMEKII